MTEREAGYLQALRDVQEAVRQIGDDLGSSPNDGAAMLGIASLLSGWIDIRLARHGNDVPEGASTENSAGHDK